MKRLVEFGEPERAIWHEQSLSVLSGHVSSLLDREVERAERIGGRVCGKGRIARRIDLVQKAWELLEEAQTI